MKKTLILFDCDGTLVDTEYLSACAFSESLAKFGLDYTPDMIQTEFLGIANTVIMKTLNERHGTAITLDAVNGFYVPAMSRDMPKLMKVLPETRDFVRGLSANPALTLCVGSNGNKAVVIEELDVGGYIGIIANDNIYAASDVARPKPYPDLYAHIAKLKGFGAADCIVVEDSVAGAKAGLAAGMRVVGYTGLAHNPALQAQALRQAGVSDIIDTMAELARFIR